MTSPVRVLMVAPSLEILGGQAIQAQRLLEKLRGSTRARVEFLPVNPRLPGPFRRLQGLKYVRTVVTSLAYWVTLLRRVRDCDIVHAFSASYWSYLLAPLPALLVARAWGRATLLNYRSGEAEDHLSRWPLSRRSIAQLADAVVVPSGYLVEVFGRFGIQAHSIVNFVPLERLPYRRRERPAARLFSNRNLEALYNVGCTIHAFARVQAVFPDASLTVAGDGSERARLERLVAELGLRHVQFVGRVTPSDMPALYSAHDVYVNSPDIDNMPSSILEAFACGLPVVSTNAGGIPYIVEHGRTGWLVERDDDEALADGILRLLREPELAVRLADAARAECERSYVWPEVQRRWEDCYEALARSRGR